MRNARLDETQAGIKIVRRNINNLRYSNAAAKLYPTLCEPIDSSPPGSPVPGILQARTLEWVTISFSVPYVHLKPNPFDATVGADTRSEGTHVCTESMLMRPPVDRLGTTA